MLELKGEMERLRKMYTADISQGTFNALILGRIGVGKTTLVETARKPVLIHSFDPGGTKGMKKAIERGDVIVDTRFEKESAKHPLAYKDWESTFESYRANDIFKGIGTYVIDSFTTWIDALKNEVAKRKGRADSVLQIQDWLVVGNQVRDVIKLATALPCDFILTGHLFLEKEEETGKIFAMFKSLPSLRIAVPMLFDEIYVLTAEDTSNEIKRSLLTQSTGKYLARTRIGRDIFNVREEPDISKMLKKIENANKKEGEKK